MINRQTAHFTDASAYSGTYLRHVSLAAISASCKPGNWDATLEQIEMVLRQALEFGFSQNELDRVKAEYLSFLDAESKQAATQKSAVIARQILSGINRKKLLLSASRKKELLTPFIESVSLADAHTAIKKAWSENHRLVMVTGNALISAPDPEKRIRDVFSAAGKKKTGIYEVVESKSFPYLKIPDEKASVKEDKQYNEIGTRQVVFNNGITLNVKKTDFKKNQFLFKVSFGPGSVSEPHAKPGLRYLAERTLQESGLGGLDADQLGEALAGKNIRFNFDIKANHFAFSGSADPKETELAFQLMYHFMNDPGIRPEALQLVKNRYRQEFDSLKRTPDGIMQISGNAFLAGDDPRFILPEPAVLSAYTIGDIKTWLQLYFAQSPIDVSIVGDIDEEAVLKLSGTYMGAFSFRSDDLPQSRFNTERLMFPSGEQKTFQLDTKIDSGVVRLAFLTDDFWDISRTRRLSILSKVISERLRITIREKLGAAYGPYAYHAPSLVFDGYGVLHVVVRVEPDTEEFVLSKMRAIVHDIHTRGVTQKEAQLVLKPVLNHIKDLRSTNSYWLSSVLSNASVYPDKFVWAENMTADYQRITSEELSRLAKKYLRPENSAVIFIGPKN